MTEAELFSLIRKKKSYLCVGLDPDYDRIPDHLKELPDPLFEFNKRIIEATAPYAVAYKLNIAFFEAHGSHGWQALEKTLEIIPDEMFTIADAKRGDIGNSSRLYAQTFFETLNFDAVTVAPYMGEDSVTPFLEFENKWVFLLALTSNPGSNDFQLLQVENQPLYERVINKSLKWSKKHPGHLGFVVGATQTQQMDAVRRLAPNSFFLIPGVGAQGGDLDTVSTSAANNAVGMLVNSSRGIIFAGTSKDFELKAANAAKKMQQKMAAFLIDSGIN